MGLVFTGAMQRGEHSRQRNRRQTRWFLQRNICNGRLAIGAMGVGPMLQHLKMGKHDGKFLSGVKHKKATTTIGRGMHCNPDGPQICNGEL